MDVTLEQLSKLSIITFLIEYNYIFLNTILLPTIYYLLLVDASNGGDLILTEDWSGPNSGVWIARSSPWTKKFLKQAFDQPQLLADYADNGRKHPFEYEQRAFHYMLDTEVWRARGLPRYNPSQVEEIRKHVVFLPQCSMNSFSMHPLEFRGNREISQVYAYIYFTLVLHFYI